EGSDCFPTSSEAILRRSPWAADRVEVESRRSCLPSYVGIPADNSLAGAAVPSVNSPPGCREPIGFPSRANEDPQIRLIVAALGSLETGDVYKHPRFAGAFAGDREPAIVGPRREDPAGREMPVTSLSAIHPRLVICR